MLEIFQAETRSAYTLKGDCRLGLKLTIGSDALLVTATLNSLGVLIKSRATIANKIINSVLMFNPLRFGHHPVDSKTRIIIRSLERTIRALIVNILKRQVCIALGGVSF
jgi:hypothetical protein